MSRYPLTLYDFRDIDLMIKLAQEGASGVTAAEMSEALGFNSEGVRSVGTRFSWMRRYGMLSLDEEKHLWTVSDGGEKVIKEHEREAGMKMVERIPDQRLPDVMAFLTRRYRTGDPMLAHLLRREFFFGTRKR